MMSREIRVGYTYHCGEGGVITETRNCEGGGESYIAFEPFDGDPDAGTDQVIFKLESNRIQRSDNSGTNFLYLTAKDVVIERLTFYVAGTDITDNIQPRVLISLGGHVDLGSVGDRGKSYFNLQTTISQRLIDF